MTNNLIKDFYTVQQNSAYPQLMFTPSTTPVMFPHNFRFIVVHHEAWRVSKSQKTVKKLLVHLTFNKALLSTYYTIYREIYISLFSKFAKSNLKSRMLININDSCFDYLVPSCRH